MSAPPRASAARRVARNAGALTVSRVAVLGLNFATWVHLARTLAPEGFGVLSFGTAVLAYFLLAVSLGFDEFTIREIARDARRVQSLAADVLGARLAIAAAAISLYLGVVLWLDQAPAARLALALLAVHLLVRAIRLDWVYQGTERMGVIALRDAVSALLTVTFALTVVRGPDDLPLAAAALVVAPLLSNAALAIAYVREHGRPRLRLRADTLKPILTAAIPLAAATFVSEIYYSLDRVMLEALRTTAEVGLYGAAYKVLGLALAPSAVLAPAFFPALANALGDPARMRVVSRTYARLMLIVGVPLAVVGPFVSAELLSLLYGADYTPVASSLTLLFANGAVIYIAMSFGIPLLAWDRQVAYLKAVLVGGVANVGLNIWLIAPYGPAGAAAATLLSELAVLVAIGWLYWRETGLLHLDLLAMVLGVVAVGVLAPLLLVSYLGGPLWARIAAVLLVYPIATVASGAMPRALLRRVFRRSAAP